VKGGGGIEKQDRTINSSGLGRREDSRKVDIRGIVKRIS